MAKKILQYFYMAVMPLLFIFSSCSSMLNDFEKLSRASQFQVEYYFERITDDEFELNETLSQTGNKDSSNVENDLSFEGFYLDSKSFETKGSCTFVKKYYKRNRVNVIFNPDGGSWEGEADFEPRILSGKYGESVSQEFYKDDFKLIRADFDFIAWDKMITVFPAEDCTVTAIWDQTYAKYTVIIKKEKADANLNTYDSDSYVSGGKPGEFTNVVAETLEGFEEPEYENAIINENGTTTIVVTYDRIRLDVIFKLSENEEIRTDCSWKDSTNEDYAIKVKYGSTLTLGQKSFIENPTRGENVSTGWFFAGWNDVYNVPEEITQDTVFVARWAKPASQYIVRTMFEKKGEPGVIDDAITVDETRIGQAGTTTNVVADKKYSGYVADEVVQKTISENDNETVVEIIYRLAQVTLTFNPSSGLWQDGIHKGTSDIIHATGKYGQSVPRYFVANPKKALNSFEGWKKTDGTVVPNNNLTFDEEDTTYTAQWKITGAYVALRFWTEDVDGNYNSGYSSGTGFDKDLTQTLIVENGKRTSIEVDESNYPGFEVKSIEQIDIPQNPDEETFYIVKVKLKRKMIKYTYAPAGGSWEGSLSGHGTSPVIKEGRYGSTVEKPVENPPLFRADYEFRGWDDEIPDTYGSENCTFTARWRYTKTEFKVQLLFENLSGTEYVQDTENYPEITEVVDSSEVLTVTPPVVPGFDYERNEGLTTENKIDPRGTTVLKIYYTRKNIVYTFDANGGKFTGDVAYKEISGKYGKAINVSTLGTPSKKNATFVGWTPDTPETLGTDSKTYKAVWEDIPLTVITGVGSYTNKDIELEVEVTNSVAKIKVTVPYDGSWSFELLDNNTVMNIPAANKSVNGAVVTFTTNLSNGNHTIKVYATENGNVKSKFKTVKVE